MELGTREFCDADQQAFATLSKDHNPLHMDRRAARRTQMGEPVVHGMNGALWMLELASMESKDLFSGIKVNFSSPIYLGERVETHLSKRSGERLRLQARVGDAMATTIGVELGNPKNLSECNATPVLADEAWPEAPIARTFGELAGLSGSFAVSGLKEVASLYPNLCDRIGSARAAGLAALSRLVGMICPGLHSIFSGLNVEFVSPASDILSFEVVETDDRFGIVRMLVSGAGLNGEVTAIARAAPTGQPKSRNIRGRVVPGSYGGANVLIVGGSRGLGEVSAKACAAGGASVTITYANGKEEALSVAKDIEREGGVCNVLHLDIRERNIEQQLATLTHPITHLYYYATGPIARRRTRFISSDVLADFLQFYAFGFEAVCRSLKSHGSNRLVAFYPSSIAIDSTPKGWVEYAMAKAAGEILSREMDLQLPWLSVIHQRLPRILTDQTANSRGDRGADVLDVILPIVELVQTGTSKREGTISV